MLILQYYSTPNDNIIYIIIILRILQFEFQLKSIYWIIDFILFKIT